jgi:hypothetical protein
LWNPSKDIGGHEALDQVTLDGHVLAGSVGRPLEQEESESEIWVELGAPCPTEMRLPRVLVDEATVASIIEEGMSGGDADVEMGTNGEDALDAEMDTSEDVWVDAAACATAEAAARIEGSGDGEANAPEAPADEDVLLELDRIFAAVVEDGKETEHGREHREGEEWKNLYLGEASARASPFPSPSR